MASSYGKIPAPETTYNGMVGKWSPSKSNPDNSSWIEKPKSTKNVDPGFGRNIPKPKPKTTPKPTLRGEAAMKEYQKQISPKGVASANAAAKNALEEKYPGMFIPEKRTTAGVKKK